MLNVLEKLFKDKPPSCEDYICHHAKVSKSLPFLHMWEEMDPWEWLVPSLQEPESEEGPPLHTEILLSLGMEAP